MYLPGCPLLTEGTVVLLSKYSAQFYPTLDTSGSVTFPPQFSVTCILIFFYSFSLL